FSPSRRSAQPVPRTRATARPSGNTMNPVVTRPEADISRSAGRGPRRCRLHPAAGRLAGRASSTASPSGEKPGQDVPQHALRLAELIPGRDAEGHLVEAHRLEDAKVPYALIHRPGRRPAPDPRGREIHRVVHVQEALGFFQGRGLVVVEVDVVVEVELDRARITTR